MSKPWNRETDMVYRIRRISIHGHIIYLTLKGVHGEIRFDWTSKEDEGEQLVGVTTACEMLMSCRARGAEAYVVGNPDGLRIFQDETLAVLGY